MDEQQIQEAQQEAEQQHTQDEESSRTLSNSQNEFERENNQRRFKKTDSRFGMPDPAEQSIFQKMVAKKGPGPVRMTLRVNGQQQLSKFKAGETKENRGSGDGASLIENINKVQENTRVNLVKGMVQNNVLNQHKNLFLNNHYLVGAEEFSKYTAGRLLPSKLLRQINLDVDCNII